MRRARTIRGALALLIAAALLAIVVSYECREAEHEDQLANEARAYRAALRSANDEAADLEQQLKSAEGRREELARLFHE